MRFPLQLLVFACALGFACPMLAEEKSGTLSDLEKAWSKVAIEKRDHAPLLERQAKLPMQLAKSPVAITVLVLDPDLAGMITAVATTYDRMENPSEVDVTVTEGGLMDDDLLAIRHVVSLAKNSSKQWRVVRYGRGELRRVHFK
jgi:hypothetical protein